METHHMIIKKGTAKASEVTPWTTTCRELGKVLTVRGTTSHVVLKLVNGPQALDEVMLGETQNTGDAGWETPPVSANRSPKESPDLLGLPECLGKLGNPPNLWLSPLVCTVHGMDEAS